MTTTGKQNKGQAVVLVTLALIAMCGLIGLAVDMGWMFFVKKQAQAAADTAAMAAVQEALVKMGGDTSGFLCGGVTGVECQAAPVDCSSVDPSGNLNNGCLYAARNGFSSTNPRQRVTMQSYDKTILPPTAPGVNEMAYWVTVRTVQTVPQLFAAVLGNTTGTVAARATAGIVAEVLPGSVFTLNREGDCVGNRCGVDIDLGGNSTITAPGPVLMSSGCNGNNTPSGCDGSAGQGHGSSGVSAPAINTRGTAPSDWGPPTPVSGMSDGKMFRDPTTGLPQPPILATSPVKTCGILNGVIDASKPLTMGPYNYYAYHLDKSGQPIPDGNMIRLSSNVTFASGGACPGLLSTGGQTQTGSFPTYFFYGGLDIGSTSATFGPGQYVLAGVERSGGSAGTLLSIDNGAGPQSAGSGASFAGDMFILTAPGYPGLSTQINAFSELQQATNSLYQGTVDIKGGAGTGTSLNGVQKGVAPSELDSYNGVLFWQDRRNSTVEYDANGNVVNAPATAAQMTANLATPDSPEWTVDAAPKGLNFNGVIYQPRGAWISFQGHGEWGGTFQLVTGAIEMGGGGDIVLTSPFLPFLRYVCALIE